MALTAASRIVWSKMFMVFLLRIAPAQSYRTGERTHVVSIARARAY